MDRVRWPKPRPAPAGARTDWLALSYYPSGCDANSCTTVEAKLYNLRAELLPPGGLEDEVVGIAGLAAYWRFPEAFMGARWIWTINLVFDNTVLLRKTVR